MKFNFLFAVFSFAILTLTSCDKTVYTIIAENYIFVQEGKTFTGNISAGNGGYKIINPRTDIVNTEVKGSAIQYTGLSEGQCTITLKDTEGQTASIQVTVGVKPMEFTKNYLSSSLTDGLSNFGLSLEEKKDASTGVRSFTIKTSNNEKLRQGGFDENYVILSNDIKYSFEISSTTELTFKTLPFSFGVTYNGNYFYVIVKDIQPTDNNMMKLSGFYFQTK